MWGMITLHPDHRNTLMLKLYNTLSRRMELFEPHDPEQVKMFTCGPSIYRLPHLGNYRTFLWEDVLQRYLGYLGHSVKRVMNLTDVEDKAIQEAEKEGKTLTDLTEGVSLKFFQEASLLRIQLPEEIPRSSTSVEQAAHLIAALLEKGIAYRHGGDIFYDPLKFPGFGKLYGLDMSRWPKKKKRFKKDTYPGQRWNLGDFILWHGRRPGSTIYWDSQVGKGRPSWNIQDPAIITKHLGYTIDISCGGADNLYRHHDYNIAVIEGVSGRQFSKYWIHGAHLLVNRKKMSKSLNNILYPSDLRQKGYSAEQIRFYLLYGHHRSAMNFTWENVETAARKLRDLQQVVQRLLDAPVVEEAHKREAAIAEGAGQKLLRSFEAGMNEDLHIDTAVEGLRRAAAELVEDVANRGISPHEKVDVRSALQRIDGVLQFILGPSQ